MSTELKTKTMYERYEKVLHACAQSPTVHTRIFLRCLNSTETTAEASDGVTAYIVPKGDSVDDFPVPGVWGYDTDKTQAQRVKKDNLKRLPDVNYPDLQKVIAENLEKVYSFSFKENTKKFKVYLQKVIDACNAHKKLVGCKASEITPVVVFKTSLGYADDGIALHAEGFYSGKGDSAGLRDCIFYDIFGVDMVDVDVVSSAGFNAKKLIKLFANNPSEEMRFNFYARPTCKDILRDGVDAAPATLTSLKVEAEDGSYGMCMAFQFKIPPDKGEL